MDTALAADLRSRWLRIFVLRVVTREDGLPEVSLGVLPGTGGTQRLARLVGKSKAIELMVTGQLFDFERGLELGLLNQILEAETHEQFSQQAAEYAAQFYTPRTRLPARWAVSSAVSRRGRRFPSNQRLRWNVNCNSSSSRRTTQKKDLTLTSASANRSLKVNIEW